MNNNGVEIQKISKQFGDFVALNDIDLTIPEGAFVVLLGPSGSGKTTLLSILGGFLEPTAGKVWINGQDVTTMSPAKRPTATVFQDYALFPHMTVAKNVGFGLAMRKVPRAERARQVEAALEIVGLGRMGGRKIHQLSGGQRQRVALARSLIVEPAVLLLDEPLGALDLNLRRQMQAELTAIQKRVGTTFIHVTHDQDEAMSIADIIVVMDHGKIEDVGSPERIYLKPKSRFAATFMGEGNLIETKVTAKHQATLEVETEFGSFSVTGEAEVNTTVYLFLRPEQIKLNDASPSADTLSLGQAKLVEKVFLGTHYGCTLIHESSGTLLKVRLPQQAILELAETFTLTAARNDVVALTH